MPTPQRSCHRFIHSAQLPLPCCSLIFACRIFAVCLFSSCLLPLLGPFGFFPFFPPIRYHLIAFEWKRRGATFNGKSTVCFGCLGFQTLRLKCCGSLFCLSPVLRRRQKGSRVWVSALLYWTGGLLEAAWCMWFHLTLTPAFSHAPALKINFYSDFVWSVNWMHCNVQFLIIQIRCITYIRDSGSDPETYPLNVSVSMWNVFRVLTGQL